MVDFTESADKESKFVGTWYFDDSNFTYLSIFMDDNTGAFACLKDDEGKGATPDNLLFFIPFVWVEENGSATLTTVDGNTVTVSIDEKKTVNL